MDPVIRLRSAVALAGQFPVLAGVDLDVDRGEVVLLQGANGAGKTSILRACAGLLRIVGGEATVLGADLVRDQRAVRRRVALLGHASALYDEMTAVDNVRFAVRAAGAPIGAIGPAMEMLGLTGRLPGTRTSALSAGQRRRVALAILVARNPELWLLDEPHAGLDAEHRELLDGLVASAVAGGATVVLASHEADRARGLADRVVTVAGGVVTAVGPGAGRSRARAPGTPAGLERPATERPASERPASERPASDRPASERPASERPASERPATDRSAVDRPAVDPGVASAAGPSPVPVRR